MVISVLRRRSVRERKAFPSIRFSRLMAASMRARRVCTRTSSASPCVHAHGCFGDADRAGSERSPGPCSAPPLIGVGRSRQHQDGARRRCRRPLLDRRHHRQVPRGRSAGRRGGGRVCAQADETARKRKPIKAVSLLMRCLCVRWPSTATPPSCQAGLLRQRRVGPHVPRQADPRRISFGHHDKRPEPPG